MSGYCVIGNHNIPMTPKITMKMDITVESTGLLINVSNFISLYSNFPYCFPVTSAVRLLPG